MANGTVVLLGSLGVDRPAMDHLVSEFGYSVKEVSTLRQLGSSNDNLVAVFFSPNAMGLECDEALQHVLRASPGALPIICHGFAENVDWPRLVDAGAFHSLPMPFSAAEVRQTLGFIWGAQRRRETRTETRSESARSAAPASIEGGADDASPAKLPTEIIA
jgi:DNA-binding NtrC family response regulator